MPMFRAGMYAATVFIGAIFVFLGVIVVASAIQTGTLTLTYGAEGLVRTDIVSRATDETRFWQLLMLTGILPGVLGAVATRWAWRRLSSR